MAQRAELADRCRKTKMCKFFLANACQRGDCCAYAHFAWELRPTPNLRCTQVCPTLIAKGRCDVRDCKFAHDLKELRRFPGPSDEHGPAEVLSKSGSTSTFCTTQSVQKLTVEIADAPTTRAAVSPRGAIAALVTAAVTTKAALAGGLEVDDEQLGRDILALQCAQETISEILRTLEQKASKAGNAASHRFSSQTEDSWSTVSPTGSFASDKLQSQSTRRGLSVRFDNSECSDTGDSDSQHSSLRAGTPGSIALDFQDVENRPAHFGRAASEGSNYKALGLRVKNTFLDGEDGGALSPVAERRRSNSAPPRMMEREQQEWEQDENDDVQSGEEADAEDDRRGHVKSEQDPLIRRTRVAKTLPAGARRAIQAAVEKVNKLSCEPMKVGPVPAGAVQIGRVLLGRHALAKQAPSLQFPRW